MISRGTESIMVGHYCLPSIVADGEKDKPAILCKSLITDLLKGKLGFKGCVVSDAMSMVGACAYTGPEQLAVQFVQTGGDMVLSPPRIYRFGQFGRGCRMRRQCACRGDGGTVSARRSDCQTVLAVEANLRVVRLSDGHIGQRQTQKNKA